MAIDSLQPDDVAGAPELLVLAALDTNLWTLNIALVAAFPELVDPFAHKRDGPTRRASRLLSDRASDLARAVAEYRRALRAERILPDPDDLLF